MRLLLLLTAVALLALPALAQIELYTPELVATACSKAQFLLLLRSSQAGQYAIQLGGPAAEFATIEPRSVSLSANRSVQLSLSLDLPCIERNWNLRLKAGNVSWALKIQALLPPSIELKPKVWAAQIPPCGAALFSAELSNPAPFVESYDFELSGLAGSSVWSETRLSLKPNSKRQVNVTFRPADCSLSGNFSLQFSARTKVTGLVASFPVELSISQLGIAKLVLAPLLLGLKNFSITNLGPKTEFLLSASPEWIAIPERLVLEQGESRELSLSSGQPRLGLHSLVITASSAATGVGYSARALVLIFPIWLAAAAAAVLVLLVAAYFVTTKLLKSKQYELAQRAIARHSRRAAIVGILVAIGLAVAVALLLPKAAFAAAVVIALLCVCLAAFLPSKSLRQRELERLVESARQELEKEYILVPKAKVEAGAPRRGYAIVAVVLLLAAGYLAIQFKAVLVQYWYGIVIGLGIGVAAIAVHVLLGQRIALKKFDFLDRKQEGQLNTGWIAGLRRVQFRLDKPAKDFLLKAVRHSSASPPAAKLVYSYFSLDSSIPPELITSLSLEFKISRAWLARHGLSPGQISLYLNEGGQWRAVRTALLASSAKWFFFCAFPHRLGLFAIGSEAGMARPTVLDYAVLGALLLLAFAGIAGAIERPGIPDQYIAVNGQAVLDLGKYFLDPDLERLGFVASATKNVQVEISGTAALLRPKPGWVGSEKVAFTAIDPQGQAATSNVFRIWVLPGLVAAAMAKARALAAILAGLALLGALAQLRAIGRKFK